MRKRRLARWVIGLGGGAALLNGCDPTIQSTVENGIINTSTALLTALIRGVIQAASEGDQTASAATSVADIFA